MIKTLDRFIRALNKVLLGLLMVILAAMLVVCMMHIFYRYVLNNSLSWSEEFMRVTLVWFCMLSVTILAARREHVSIVIFKKMMPKKVGAFLDRFTQGLTVVTCAVITVIGVRMVTGPAGRRGTPAMGLPYSVAYAAIPVAFAIVTLYEFRNLLVDISKGDNDFAAVEKPKDDIGEIKLE